MLATALLLTTSVLSAQQALPFGRPTTLISPQLAPPSELVALPCGDQVELSWRDNSNETAFVILRRPSNSPHFVELALTGADATSFLDTDVPDGAFVYRVAARRNGLTSPPSTAVSATFPNAPPVLTTDLAEDLSQDAGSVLTFTVTATDPEGDAVSLQLLNPPPGMVFDPIVAEPSPATVHARWVRESREELQTTLVFQSNCAQLVRRVRLSDQGYPFDTAVLVGDVTGDARLDAVVGAEAGGRAYVFAGASTPSGTPTATLQVAGDSLRPRDSLQVYLTMLGDVTGDGRLDVVSASQSQKIYVWAGGAGLTGTPTLTATLAPPGTSSTDTGLEAGGPLVQLVDVNGDGTQDIVTVDAQADVGGTSDTGAIFLWLGGAGLTGTQAPSRVLSVPGAAASDQLGFDGPLVLADATGDGVLDLLAAAKLADIGATIDAGAVYLWSGAAVLAGATAPTATLTTPGFPASVGQILLGDLNGNGVLDIVAGLPDADIGGVDGVGAFHVWYGGALSGTVPAAATLRIAGAAAQLALGSYYAGLADVTGDTRLDFLALTPQATVFGHAKAGAVFVWSGNGLAATPPPTATLGVPDAEDFDLLGNTNPSLQLAELDGDGILDVVTGSLYAASAYVWNGGALAGNVAPSATFRAGPPGGEQLTFGPYGIQLVDMDGEGALDLVAAAPWEDYEGTNTGGAYVWSGAGGFGAADPPTVRLGHASGGQIGAPRLADIDGDDDDDLLLSTLSNSRLFLWRAGSDFFDSDEPDAILSGVNQVGSSGFVFADWNGDGILDVVATTASADPGGVVDAGVVQAWFGGPGLLGTVNAPVTLAVPGARAGDYLGSEGVRLLDLTGDGRLDVLACSPSVDASATRTNTGAVYLWAGAATLAGTLAPSTTFAVPGAGNGLRLGDPHP